MSCGCFPVLPARAVLGCLPREGSTEGRPELFAPRAAHSVRKVCSDSWCSPARAHPPKVPREGA